MNLKSWFGFCDVLTNKPQLHQEIIPFFRATGLGILSVHTSVHVHAEAVCLRRENTSLADVTAIFLQLCCCHAMLLRKHLLSLSDSASLSENCNAYVLLPL